MRTATINKLSAKGVAICAALSVLGGMASARPVTLPTGTVIPLKLDGTLSSKTALAGDKFAARVVTGKDDAGLPNETLMEGVVREAMPAAKGKPGVLDIDFKRVVFPNGKSEAVVGTLYSLDAKAVKRSSSGRLVASNDKSKDRLKFVGIGAGAGLVIATLTKGNTITDTVIGAGLGYLVNELGNKKVGDVELKSGTQFGIRLDRQLVYDTTYVGRRTASTKAVGEQYYTPERKDVGDRDVDRTRDNARNDDRQDIGMLVNDQNVDFRDAKPYLHGEVPMAPIEEVSKAVGFTYTYDAKASVISANSGKVRLGVGSRIVVVDGVRKRLPAEAEMHGGKLYVPMQFLAYATNGVASWDASSRTIVLTTER